MRLQLTVDPANPVALLDAPPSTFAVSRETFAEGDPVPPEADEPEVPEPVADPADETAGMIRWVLAVEGVPTGDGRIFDADSLTWRDLPLPLMALDKTTDAHLEARLVGHFRVMRKEGAEVAAYSTFIQSDDPEVVRLQKLIADGDLPGVSVDLDQLEGVIEYTIPDDPELPAVEVEPDELAAPQPGEVVSLPFAYDDEVMRVTHARIMGATAVPFPALMEAKSDTITGEQESLAASLMSGTMSYLHRGLTAAVGSPEECVEAMHVALSEFGDIGDLAPEVLSALDEWAYANAEPADEPPAEDDDSLVAAIAPPVEPPADWFSNPHFFGPTEMTVTDDGRVFGHLAQWDSCHVGFGNECILAPRSRSSYAAFTTGELVTAEGGRVRVGQITTGAGHAPMTANARLATEHYDNTGWAAADVAAGEDRFGIWVAGALRPGQDPAQVREFMASAVSGDWRSVNGALELVGIASVNVPGFHKTPTVQARVASGEVQALVATAVAPCQRVRSFDEQRVAERIAMSVGRHPVQLMGRRDALAARIGRDLRDPTQRTPQSSEGSELMSGCKTCGQGPPVSNVVTAAAVRASQAGAQTYHEVWIGDQYTGRRFTSIISAQQFARSHGDGATIRTTS